MIVNIRGTSGAGKSHLVYSLIAVGKGLVPVFPETLSREEALERYTYTKERSKIMGYCLNQEVSSVPSIGIVGKYETTCGGCDTIKTQDRVVETVSQFARRYDHVVFEGLLVSQIYQRYADFAKRSQELISQPTTWLCLNTPLNVCIARVIARRQAAGNLKPFNPDNSLAPKWESCVANFQKAQRDGLDPIWLDYKNPLPMLLKLVGMV